MVCKYRLALIKAINLKLKVAKKEVHKKQELVERRKAEAIVAKQQKEKEGIRSFNEDDNNYYSDINDTDPDQENNLNLVQGCNIGKKLSMD